MPRRVYNRKTLQNGVLIIMATFILIHGAWHGGWCWEQVTPILEEQGHRVLAPDLPCMGKDNTPLEKITLDSWVQFVCDLARQQNEKVILVGHSRGGLIISQVAEYIPEHIQGLIYLTAFLIPNGATLLETLRQQPQPSKQPPDIVISDDKRTSTITTASVRNTFYNTSSEELIKRATSLLVPEPMVSFVTPLALTDEKFGQVPRAYIECLQDMAIPISLQRSMLSKLPCQQVQKLDTDHSPFYSAPAALAASLAELVIP